METNRIQRYRWASATPDSVAIRRMNNLYPTPLGACEVLTPLALEHNATPLRVLDIGAGYGQWGEAVRHFSPGAWIEGLEVDETLPINEAYDTYHIQDFGYFVPPHRYDLIIGNPPYHKELPQWITKCRSMLSENGILAWLLRTEFMGGQGRYKGVFRDFPPEVIHQIVGRVSFTYKEPSARANYDNAFFIWKKTPSGNTSLRWVDDRRVNLWQFSFKDQDNG